MSAVIDGLVFGLKKNVDYATRLVADLGESQMIQQPAGLRPSPLNHPAWVLSHLNVYIPVMIALVRGEEFDDPKSHPFGMQSKPENDRSIYPLKNELVQTFVQGHDRLPTWSRAPRRSTGSTTPRRWRRSLAYSDREAASRLSGTRATTGIRGWLA